jgi:hypothetical protein
MWQAVTGVGTFTDTEAGIDADAYTTTKAGIDSIHSVDVGEVATEVAEENNRHS